MNGTAAATVLPSDLVIGARRRGLVYVVLGLAVLLPLAFVDIPGLVDYPNHLARVHVLTAIDSDPALAENYQVAWGAMPNLAMDLVMQPLAAVLPLQIAGRVFVVLTMLALVGGTLALHRVLHGDIGLWPTAVFMLLYNHLLIMGFLNYLFAIGLALALFAGWIASERGPPWIRWALFPAALVGLFFAHLFALAVYGVCVAGYEFPRLLATGRRDRRIAARQAFVVAWPFLPAALLVLGTMPDATEHGFLYGPFLAKVRAVWSPTLAYLKPVDAAVFLFAAAVPLAGFATGRLRLAYPLRLPLAALTAGALAMPFWVQGTWGSIWYADLRLPTVVALLLVAGLRPRTVSPRIAIAVLIAGAVLLGARLFDVALEWRRMDRDFAEFRTAARVIERGAAILPVQRRNAPVVAGDSRFDYAYWHLSALAVIDRGAFVPTLFTDPTKQPVRAAAARLDIDTAFGAPIDVALLVRSAGNGNAGTPPAGFIAMQDFWTDWPSRFDYVLLTHFGVAENPLPGRLTALHEGSYFTLYAIRQRD